MAVKPVPEGYHTVTPYLIVRGAEKTIDFARKAFGAEVDGDVMKMPDGKVMHAALKIGDSRVMISDANEQHPPMPSMLHLYVPNVDALHARAVAAGGTSTMQPEDQFYGDRGSAVKDPAGITWFISTHKEDLSTQEIRKRAEAHMKAQRAA